ncbi:unnamed protein product, partial [marine sediment metagenome]
NNSVDGKPILYLEGATGEVISNVDAGQVILVSCGNIAVENINTYVGIELLKTSKSRVVNNHISAMPWMRWASQNGYICLTEITGIYLESSSDNEITGNEIKNDTSQTPGNTGTWQIGEGIGISLQEGYGPPWKHSSSNLISNNAISDTKQGITLSESSNDNILRDNSLTRTGLFIYDSYHNTVSNNSVDGKPILYLEGATGEVISNVDAGQVILVSCGNIAVENINTYVGIELLKTSKSRVVNNHISAMPWMRWASQNGYICLTEITGIYLESSSDNVISGNELVCTFE